MSFKNFNWQLNRLWQPARYAVTVDSQNLRDGGKMREVHKARNLRIAHKAPNSSSTAIKHGSCNQGLIRKRLFLGSKNLSSSQR